jgi:hypothetical protein
MRPIRLIVAMTAIALLGAIAAGAASAENVTSPSRWYINGAGLTAGQSEKVKCSVGNHNGEGAKLVLHGLVGEAPSQVEVTLTATGIECINHEGASEGNGSARIEQTGAGTEANPYRAEAFARMTFTGVTLSKQAAAASKAAPSRPTQFKSSRSPTKRTRASCSAGSYRQVPTSPRPKLSVLHAQSQAVGSRKGRSVDRRRTSRV